MAAASARSPAASACRGWSTRSATLRFHLVVPRWACCGGVSSSLVHSRMTPLIVPPPSSAAHAFATAGPFERVRGHVILQVPERARGTHEPLAVDRRLLIGQLLPLSLTLLLGLGHRDQDPRGQPPGIGAQVDVPVHLGEPHLGLIEPGDQVLQVQRLADETGPT